ncbi:MAG: UvrD-helicase domain-containing protein, partial [Pseudomonadota bacterium]
MVNALVQLVAHPGGSAPALDKAEGIDHIMVDEAQDTSPLQWEMVSALTDEFFA